MTEHTDTNRSGDLVEWLRKIAEWLDPEIDLVEEQDALEAADRIEALEAENERLRGAIGDIKEAWDWWNVDTYDRCAGVVDDAIRAAMGVKQ